MAIIDGSNSRDDTRFMVQNSFNDVRGNAHHCHIGGYGSPDIVNPPVIRAHGTVQTALQPPEARYFAFSVGCEHEIGL